MTEPSGGASRADLLRAFERVRATTERLCRPLAIEDMVVQTMPDVSPTKWHLAHVTWFFETFVLARSGRAHTPFDARFGELFNSYYRSLGRFHPRPQRGHLSRPTVEEVFAYRHHVDTAIRDLLDGGPERAIERVAPSLVVGLHHEQQHQELMLMDIKHVFAQNPLRPAYRGDLVRGDGATSPVEWCAIAGGLVEIGHGEETFAFDNERPRHAVFVAPFELASRPVTVGEYREFVDDGGYERPELWLSDGWDAVQAEGWRAPLYWARDDGDWHTMTLGGVRGLDAAEPVCHVSYYEANAFASWAGCRLPTEFEWECAAAGHAVAGTFLESEAFHPRARARADGEALAQLFGDVWEWTASAYAPYPGYVPFEAELGEYNGKFMVNQLVLRGGGCVTPASHLRATYRNFFQPHQRWMFAGFRLARSR